MQTNESAPVETNARTWGEVKAASSRVRGMLGSGDVKLVIKQTKATIETDDVVLPEGDITVYIFPGKVKAGNVDFKECFSDALVPVMAGMEAAFKQDLEESNNWVNSLPDKPSKPQPTPFNWSTTTSTRVPF